MLVFSCLEKVLIVLALIGSLTGFMITLTGSGGIIAMPLMLLLTSMPIQQILAITLVGSLVTAVFGLTQKLHQKLVPEWPIVFSLVSGGILGTPLGTRLSLQLSPHSLSVIACMLLISIIILNTMNKNSSQTSPNILGLPWVACCGFVVGIISSLLGIGGGFLLLPILLYTQNMSMQQVASTSVCVLIAMSSLGLFWHLKQTVLNYGLLEQYLLGSCIGALLGNWGSRKLSRSSILVLFNTMLAAIVLIQLARLGWH
jgi:uncharacterized protein